MSIYSIAIATFGTILMACGGGSGTKSEKMEIKHLTKAEFLNRVYDYEASPSKFELKGDKPVLVDFYASWCGPCKMVAPVLEEIAKEYEGRIDVYKVNVDDEQDLSAKFNIRSIPTLLFIPKDGTPQMIAGAMPKDALRAKVNELLLK